jgi:hypothetical protein
MGDRFASISEPSASLNNKKIACVSVVGIINVQQGMLGVVFEGYVVSRYGSYIVVRNGFKYIHYYLTNHFGYLMTRPKFLKRPKCGF